MPLSSSSVSSSAVDNNNVIELMDQELEQNGDVDVFDEVDGIDYGLRRAVSDSTQTDEFDTVDSRPGIVGRLPMRGGECSNSCNQDGGLLSNLITLVLPARRKRGIEPDDGEPSGLLQPLAVNIRSVSTQTEESPASIRGYELCCMVIQELVLENPVSQSLRDDVFESLCCCVCEILDKHSILFNGMLRRFEVTDYRVFYTIANELFEVSSENNEFRITWGRVVSLFAFAVKLAQKHKEDQDEDKIDNVVHYLSDYIARELLDFVVNNGGWEGLVKQFPLPDTEDKQVKRAMLWSGLCVGLVATIQIHLLTVMRKNEIILLINGLIEFENSNVRDEYLPDELRVERNKGRWFLWFGVICSFSFPILTSLPVWFLPCSPQFPSSLLLDCPNENFSYLQYIMKVPFLVLEMMLIALSTHAAYVYLTLLIFSPTSFDIYVKQIRAPLPNLNVEHEMKNRCQRYRQIQILHKLYHEIFQYNWLPGLEAQLCVLITLGLYGMVDLKGVIEMPGYLCFPALAAIGCIVVSYLFRMADDCCESSNKLIESWRQMRNDNLPKFQERWLPDVGRRQQPSEPSLKKMCIRPELLAVYGYNKAGKRMFML
ncbi:unnamed protein product [Orchesella dallaii]|uniref:Bcl-2 Bcl-2 homology region 1-3 domain-containing protein n=1 Tax=Orchesella dallaii TaxID=48710 RepID=A0ABP1QY38_9HEXA